jgi:hypothetical protein
VPVGRPSGGIRLIRFASAKSGSVRWMNPRGYPGVPTKDPFEATTISCSTQLCASVGDGYDNAKRAKRLSGFEKNFIMKAARVFGFV